MVNISNRLQMNLSLMTRFSCKIEQKINNHSSTWVILMSEQLELYYSKNVRIFSNKVIKEFGLIREYTCQRKFAIWHILHSEELWRTLTSETKNVRSKLVPIMVSKGLSPNFPGSLREIKWTSLLLSTLKTENLKFSDVSGEWEVSVEANYFAYISSKIWRIV